MRRKQELPDKERHAYRHMTDAVSLESSFSDCPSIGIRHTTHAKQMLLWNGSFADECLCQPLRQGAYRPAVGNPMLFLILVEIAAHVFSGGKQKCSTETGPAEKSAEPVFQKDSSRMRLLHPML